MADDEVYRRMSPSVAAQANNAYPCVRVRGMCVYRPNDDANRLSIELYNEVFEQFRHARHNEAARWTTCDALFFVDIKAIEAFLPTRTPVAMNS